MIKTNEFFHIFERLYSISKRKYKENNNIWDVFVATNQNIVDDEFNRFIEIQKVLDNFLSL